MSYEVLLFLHVLGACVLLGTGMGIAFFMWASNRSRDPALIAHVAGIVVVADTVFTATAAVAQPLTGWLLAREAGWPLSQGWILAALALYVLVGCCWLPVVGIQLRLRALAIEARDRGQPLSPAYGRLYQAWLALGVPAFSAVVAILWLMIAKPF